MQLARVSIWVVIEWMERICLVLRHASDILEEGSRRLMRWRREDVEREEEVAVLWLRRGWRGFGPFLSVEWRMWVGFPG